MSKRKKSITKRSLSPTSSPEMNVNLELDIKALRGKNKQLTQAVAKLQQEKAFQLSQMTTLQKEFFTLNSKYVNLKSVFSTIDATMKGCFSKQIELVNSLGKVVRLCALGATASNLNKDPKTQTVKPQFVNGHVLQNPTITLSRFNDSDSHTPQRISPQQISPNISGGGNSSASPVRRINNVNLSPSVVCPSTSRMPVSPIDTRLSNQETNENNDNLQDLVQNFESEIRRRNINLERLQLENEDEENGLDTPDESEDEINDLDNRSRLVTIQEEEEEAYNSTLRSLNTSQTDISDRVREIRIFLDPLPKDYINQWENIGHYVTRTSSVTGEPSISELDPNNTLLNETLASPESTMKFMSSIRESQNLSSKSSPSKRISYFGEPSCSTSRLEDSEVVKVQVERGSHKNLNSTPQKFEYESTSSMSENSSVILPVRLRGINNFSSSISAIQDSPCDNTQLCTMKSLGLEPKESRLTTSTPVPSCRSSSRNKKSNVSLNSTKTSPVDSKVTKRRGGSNDKKIAHIVVNRLSLEKRLSGSPIKKIGDLLNATPIIRSSDIRRGNSRKKTQGYTQKTDKNASSSSSDEENTPKSSQTKKLNKKSDKGKTKGKENRVSQTPIQPIRSSPRPRRAAKPKTLKEPSLSKKMRRSR